MFRYAAEWSVSGGSNQWGVIDQATSKVLLNNVSQSTAQFVALTMNLRYPYGKEKSDANQ